MSGLFALNAFALAVGVGMLWGIRGWQSWRELIRLLGVAYMLGIAGLGVALSLSLVVAVPLTPLTIVVLGTALAAGGLAAGQRLGRQWRTPDTARPRRLGVVAACFGAVVAVYLEASFREARLNGLYAWDAWAFWVPKAKAIYFYGGLDEQFIRELANPTYPPLIPALEAASFHAMGSADVVTLHVQFWFFLVGFVAAAAGLLAPRVAPAMLWPGLVLVLAAPRVAGRALEPQADFLLDYFFALSALLVALWLIERRPWQLVSASLLLGSAMLTKREGQLLAACVVAAALAASWGSRRFAWPRLGLALVAAVALAVPWRIWFTSNGLTGELPSEGTPPELLANAERAWPAVRSVYEALFSYELWLVVPPIALAAIALAFIGGARVLPVYAASVYGLATVGFVWVLWSFTELELPIVQDEAVNPIVRLTGSLVILSAVVTPLMLDAAWRGGDDRADGG